VRTTIRIDDDLYRSVKERAARSGRTVASVLEDAVRAGLATDATPARKPFSIRPRGRGGLRPGVDLASNAAIAEVLDEERSLDALR
jgi:plasmid stability protein